MIYITEQKDLQQVYSFVYVNSVFTIDTETKGTGDGNWNSPFGSKIVLFQIGNDAIQYVINAESVDITLLLKLISKPKYLKIGQNIKYDYKVIRTNYNIILNNVWDTMIASQLLSTGLDLKHSLYDISERYLNYRPDGKTSKKTTQLSLFENIDKDIRTTFDGEITEAHIEYAAKDVELTHQLYDKLKTLLSTEGLSLLARREFEFSLVLGDMELNGMPLNTEKWLKLAEEVKERCNNALQKLKDVADINWNSYRQVIGVFKPLGIPTDFIDSKTGEVKESVAASKLKKYKNTFSLVKDYLSYKEIKKQETSYGLKFLQNLDPITNNIHSNFLQLMITGRSASNAPNMQNIPRKGGFRECFESETSFIMCDYASQEIGVLAYRANDHNLIDTINSGRDVHSETASKVWKVEVIKDKLNTDLRDKAKTVIFLINYGGGASKLAEGTGVSLKEAKNIIKNVFIIYPELEPYFIKERELALTNGYIIADDIYHRKIHLKMHPRYKQLDEFIEYFERRGWRIPASIKNEHSSLKAEMERLAQNFPIQSTSATMIKIAGILLRRYLLSHPNAFKISLLVHDEWIIEKKDVDSGIILQKCMRHAARMVCPGVTIKPELKEVRNWQK